MKRFLITIVALAFYLSASPQHFFESDVNPDKEYLILTNPTVHNLQTIQFLIDNRLLRIDLKKVNLVGVYYNKQKYDFAKTQNYIESKQLKNIFLQEVSGRLDGDNLFETNDCTALLQKVFDHSIGIFFFGGPDIPPGLYGQENSFCEITDTYRHYFEATFLFQLLGGSQNVAFTPFLHQKPDYLVTGFCLGMQTMNVATGGSLFQDIPHDIYGAEGAKETLQTGKDNLHRNYWPQISNDSLLMGINLHPIQFTQNPFFTSRLKLPHRLKPLVVSSHHQAADKLGKNLEVCAVSADGKVVEALVHRQYPNVFAVQFHPEIPGIYKNLDALKFHPDDKPQSYKQLLGRKSVKFHKKFWRHISSVIQNGS